MIKGFLVRMMQLTWLAYIGGTGFVIWVNLSEFLTPSAFLQIVGACALGGLVLLAVQYAIFASYNPFAIFNNI